MVVNTQMQVVFMNFIEQYYLLVSFNPMLESYKLNTNLELINMSVYLWTFCQLYFANTFLDDSI